MPAVPGNSFSPDCEIGDDAIKNAEGATQPSPGCRGPRQRAPETWAKTRFRVSPEKGDTGCLCRPFRAFIRSFVTQGSGRCAGLRPGLRCVAPSALESVAQ